MPATQIANSKSVRSFLEFLIARGNKEMMRPLDHITEQVHKSVFGPIIVDKQEQDEKSRSPSGNLKRSKSKNKFAKEEKAYLGDEKLKKTDSKRKISKARRSPKLRRKFQISEDLL